MSQHITSDLDIEENALKQEMNKRANELADNLMVCMEILEECFAEASNINTGDDRKEVLQSRFDFISAYIGDKRLGFRTIVKEFIES